MIAGGLAPEDGANFFWGLWWSCDSPEEIGAMLQLLHDWWDAPQALRNEEAIRAEMREIARGVVRAADAALR